MGSYAHSTTWSCGRSNFTTLPQVVFDAMGSFQMDKRIISVCAQLCHQAYARSGAANHTVNDDNVTAQHLYSIS